MRTELVSPLVGATVIATLIAVISFFAEASESDAQKQFREYVRQCNAQIAEVSAFDCADGATVPITVNGSVPHKYTPGMSCDRPALLDNGAESDGQCVPYSRILNLSKPGTQAVAMCRQKKIREESSPFYDEIDVISHNPETGATCWYQAKGTDEKPLNGSNITPPDDPDALSFWEPVSTVVADGCGNCHDNDPFMFSPFVAQVWSEVPTNPFGPYRHVGPEFGFSAWPTMHLAPRDSTCTGCHRIGVDQTCGQLMDFMTGRDIPRGSDKMAKRFPASHAMPPGRNLTETAWNIIHAGSVGKLAACCADPKAPACKASPIFGIE